MKNILDSIRTSENTFRLNLPDIGYVDFDVADNALEPIKFTLTNDSYNLFVANKVVMQIIAEDKPIPYSEHHPEDFLKKFTKLYRRYSWTCKSV